MENLRIAEKLAFYVKYPFAMPLEEFLSRFYGGTKNVIDIINYSKSEYVERAILRIKVSLSNLKYVPLNFEELELTSFYIGFILTSLLGKWYVRKYVDSETKRAHTYLLGDSSENVLKLANRLEIRIEYLGSKDLCGETLVIGYRGNPYNPVIYCFQYKLPLTTYLMVASKLFSEIKWKLVNQYVKNGYVYLNKKDVVRLLEEYIRFMLLASIPEVSAASINERVKEILTRLQHELPVKEEVHGVKPQISMGIVDEEAFPPCIKNILNQLRNNEHLSHSQRFALATFLINIGADTEYVLELFKYSPDFNEKIARYQIEHIAGLRGSRKKYLSYSCDKMRSLGICVATCSVKNPLAYYSKTLRAKKS